ncbi:protein cramped-like [Rhipicephalus sanguineus]|uniref:protein cramped-like n=1 Tax=Rhipicephalus sanguineus TaxID=34632 RepID=UPI001895ECC8|nr:protein cramped-like [Rhipicephalus sanguineus]
MVKRKKPGSCSAQEEKRPEDPSTEAGKEGDSSAPNRAEPAAVQQLARTRSQNAPRLGSPSGVNSAAAGDDGASEKQETKSAAPVQRSSLRVTKRPRKDVSPPPSSSNQPPSTNAAANKKSSAVSKQSGADAGKTRRPWELWSIEDKNAFFEAVCEFGKDFESIQSYIAQRSKKKGVPAHCIKNKDQVRHFYYRTWHKIAKVMDIGEGREDVKKQTQELYGLINYAELRKKYSACINQKSGQLLTELVLTGSTLVKIRGKRIRIKTPVCRALKKINNVDTKDEPPKLPADVWVEFRPRTNAAWVQVQSLAQNPRVRTKTSLQRRLSNVLEHLQARWKPLRLRQKEQAVASLAGTDCKLLASMEPEVAQELRVWPSTPISPVSISAMASSLDVSFQCHRKKAATLADGLKSRPAKPTKQSRGIKAAASQAAASSTATANAAQDSTMDTAVVTDPAQQNSSSSGGETPSQGSSVPSSPPPPAGQVEENPEDEAAKSLTLLRSMLEPDPPATTTSTVQGTQRSATPNAASSPPPVPMTPAPMPAAIESVESILADGSAVAGGLTLGQLLGKAAEEARQGGEEEEDEAAEEAKRKKKREEEEQEEKKSQQELEEEAKRKEEEENARERSTKGWTAQEAGLMTIGELYLMMGCPSKIILHYDFCAVEQKVDRKSKISLECTTMLKKLLSLATVMFAEKSKQGPLSPPAGRCGSSTGVGGGRGTAAVSGTPPSGKSGSGSGGARSAANAGGTPPSGKSTASRALGRSPSTRTAQRPTLQQVQQAQVLENAADGASANPGTGTDQHVFVVPMGMAPRAHKQAGVPVVATDITHQEQLDRLVPGNRRGMRLRTTRKPLVVQRPLLPRADRRPVTLVQLLPSTQATLAAVVQPLASDPLPQGKGIVKLIHPAAATSIAGATFDMQPVQVPLIDASSVAMSVSPSGHPVTTSSPAVMEATSTSAVLVASQQAHTVAVVQNAPQTTNLVVDEPPVLALAESAEATKTLAGDALDVASVAAAAAAASPVRVQPLSPPNISSLLDISLPESLPSEGTTAQILGDATSLPSLGSELSGLSALDADGPAVEASNPLPSFTAVADSDLASAFKLACEEVSATPVEKSAVIDKTDGLTTPPMSPFKLVPSAPDPNWLNGEGSNFSLSSLLNTLDSPLKVTPPVGSQSVVPEPPVLALENSSLDSISRLAPDVDTQLQCLMNENSVDYVAKFADLAAQIASSNSEGKAT